jgi:hypothetical protein
LCGGHRCESDCDDGLHDGHIFDEISSVDIFRCFAPIVALRGGGVISTIKEQDLSHPRRKREGRRECDGSSFEVATGWLS